MHRPPKDDTQWAGGLLINAKECEDLREILHYLTDVLPRACSKISKSMVKRAAKFDKDMFFACTIESLKGKKIKPSKVDLELAERCLARLEEESKCPCCGYPKCGHEHGKSKGKRKK